jgi:CRP-like cAMP-binding protein
MKEPKSHHAECLDRLPLFAALTGDTRRRLASAGVERHYRTGAVLFREGSEPDGLYVVLSGRIRVVRARGGRQQVIHTEQPGGTLSEIPFFAGGPLPATAIAAEPSRCLVLDHDALRAVMQRDTAVAWLFLRRLSTRIRDLVDRLHGASGAVPTRLAAFLLARARASRPGPFSLGMTQAELAEELGTVREVVVRGLARLRTDGLVAAAGRGRFVIRDAVALRVRAGL